MSNMQGIVNIGPSEENPEENLGSKFISSFVFGPFPHSLLPRYEAEYSLLSYLTLNIEEDVLHYFL